LGAVGLSDWKDRLPAFVRENYECYEWRHASAIMEADFTTEWRELCDALEEYRLYQSYIEKPGGNKSQTSHYFDRALQPLGWREVNFDAHAELTRTEIPWNPQKLIGKAKPAPIVTGLPDRDIPTHSIDCFKNGVAVEIEWNNKDPFYDRDLNNFRLLFDLRAISVGAIITRSDELEELVKDLGRKGSFGGSTTHMSKLLPRIEGGGAAGCPLLVFGITKKLYVED
jgi:hypothetical protein